MNKKIINNKTFTYILYLYKFYERLFSTIENHKFINSILIAK